MSNTKHTEDLRIRGSSSGMPLKLEEVMDAISRLIHTGARPMGIPRTKLIRDSLHYVVEHPEILSYIYGDRIIDVDNLFEMPYVGKTLKNTLSKEPRLIKDSGTLHKTKDRVVIGVQLSPEYKSMLDAATNKLLLHGMEKLTASGLLRDFIYYLVENPQLLEDIYRTEIENVDTIFSLKKEEE